MYTKNRSIQEIEYNAGENQIYVRLAPGKDLQKHVRTRNQMHIQPPGLGVEPGTHCYKTMELPPQHLLPKMYILLKINSIQLVDCDFPSFVCISFNKITLKIRSGLVLPKLT